MTPINLYVKYNKCDANIKRVLNNPIYLVFSLLPFDDICHCFLVIKKIDWKSLLLHK